MSHISIQMELGQEIYALIFGQMQHSLPSGRQIPTRLLSMPMVEVGQCQIGHGYMTHGIQFQTAFQGQDTLSVVGKSAQVQA